MGISFLTNWTIFGQIENKIFISTQYSWTPFGLFILQLSWFCVCFFCRILQIYSTLLHIFKHFLLTFSCYFFKLEISPMFFFLQTFF